MISFSKPTVEQFFRTYAINGFSVNKDESRIAFISNLNGKMNLWAIDLNESGFPYLFAQHDENSSFIKFDPENRYVLTSYDKDGDENYQIYALPYEGGLPEPLITGSPEEKYFFIHLSNDGKRIYYVTSEDNPSLLNTRVRSLEDGSDTLLLEGENGLTMLEAVSESEELFVYSTTFANTYSTGFIMKGVEKIPLTPDPEKVHITHDPIFADESSVYFITDYEEEYSYLAKFDIGSREFSKVVGLEKESITSINWHKDSQTFYIVSEKGVTDHLYSYEVETGKLAQLKTPVDILDQLTVTKQGNLYLLGRSATVPPNIFLSATGKEWKQLTDNRVLGLDKEHMVDPDVISYPSFDGLEIEALLFKAKPENDNGYTIFWPHGGPQAAERKHFRALFQCFLNRGYNIFAPNFRGSSGYGSSFVKMVEHDWGEGPRLDNVEGVKWLFDQGISSPEKLFLIGGSYGGYMALLLHGRHPEYFKAVIDIFGVSDLFSFVESVPEHWKPLMELWIGNPERDRERFIKDSPITYLDTMTKPMFVVQGAKDPRVVQAESDKIVRELEAKGREVEYLVLEDEGHGFSKKENEIEVYSRMLEFLEKHQ